MKKRIVTLLLALVMIVSLVGGAIPALAAEDGITLRLHYHREDGEYEGWEMWFWDPDGTSSLEPPYEFVEEDGEMVSTISIKPGTMQVGFIVRYGDWEKKDIDSDQFIDIAGILGGTLDYYVESGVPGGELKKGADVKEGVVVVNSKYDPDQTRVVLKMSSELAYEATNETFSIYNSDGAVEITSVKPVGQYYYLTLAAELDRSRGYTVKFEDTEYALGMPDYFSSDEFESQFTYEGDDLGATYTSEKTTLRVWAPTALEVSVNLYSNGDPDAQATPDKTVPMTKDVQGTWVATLDGDMNGTYYTYLVKLDNGENEACDPYGRTTGVNGQRSMILDLASTNPEGWADDKDPHYDGKYTDAIIYELHVRDLSSDASSGIEHAGKYLGLIERGTTNSEGIPTGLDHIVDLGVTHVHLLPVYDFGSVDETLVNDPDAKKFNWGYDPVNYNVPEGSYSTDPYKGEVRVTEFKQMVKGMHDAGISVIMDVVYNHVQDANKFSFNKIVPGYFTRPGSNGSGCGNDVASERAMVSKYIVDSVNYWADEYHIDGFRFDLAGLLDTDTINNVVSTVHEKHPNVIFYGEGWTAGATTPTKPMTQALMANSSKTPNFAYFSDTIRNGVKGGTYGGVSAGYISGGSVSAAELNSCFKGMPSWCQTPYQSINYISAHDNNTLFDHITMVAKTAALEDRIAMNKLGVAFYMTAQGIPFMQAGEEMLRSKVNPDGTFNENSYNASDDVNSLKWDTLNDEAYMDVFNYYKGLIAFRKAHPALRLTNAADVESTVTTVSGLPANVLAYNIKGGINGETADNIFVVFNANKAAADVTLPAGDWHICADGLDAGVYSLGTTSGTVSVSPISAMILVQGEIETPPIETPPIETPPVKEPGGISKNMLGLIIAVSTIVVVAIAVVVVYLLKKKK